MPCFQLRVPVCIVSITTLMFLLTIAKGLAVKKSGSCTAVCIGNDCITFNQDKVDFRTSQEECKDSNGELLVFQSETDKSLFDILSQERFENAWIGLHLPAGACSNLSAPLRGYEWTSDEMNNSFIPSSIPWNQSVELCSPHCISLSNDQKWTERLCSDKVEGFLCKTKLKDACQVKEGSVSAFIPSSKSCKSGPCEQYCKDVKGGYACSCPTGYIPDSKDPNACKLHCAQQKCPAVCREQKCYCPDGFMLSENFCEDIDECTTQWCDQQCENTFGGYVCACDEGFVLHNKVNCISADQNRTEGLAANSNVPKVSAVLARRFPWIWIAGVGAVIVSIFVIRFYVVKRQRERENSSQQSPVHNPVASDEC